MSKFVTRIAPSPTGFLHFGLARTALFNYVLAKKFGGEFIVRIEDTDKARNKPEYESDINEQLAWLGLKADRTYRQSENVERHKACLADLISQDKAYVSKEPAKDDAARTVEVVRLRNPGEKLTFVDGIRGDITFDTTELKDFVIARSIDEPLYHFAVVVDDHDEGVTHVIRGDDHISNTPRQILILRALGFELPEYTHLPLILMPDKTKMSKRKHETAVKTFREQGILPEALINYIAMLGWTPKGEREVLPLQEIINEFEIGDLHKNGAVFDVEKLRWFNRQYVLQLPEDSFMNTSTAILKESLSARSIEWKDSIVSMITPLIRERISTWQDLRDLCSSGEFDFFFDAPQLEASSIPKGDSAEHTIRHLEFVHGAWSSIADEAFKDAEVLKSSVWEYASEAGRGKVLWPLRYSLTGRERSPDPFIVASTLGKEITLNRIESGIAALRAS